MKLPQECNSIEEVRQQIDAVDSEIMRLFGLRFKYVQEVVKYKSRDRESIVASKRREEVLKRRRELAELNGLNPDIFENMYKMLIDHFIEEELKIANK